MIDNFQKQPLKTDSFSTIFDSRSINWMLGISFVAIAIIPLLILSFALWNSAWENTWREVEEKHKLLAINLVSPLSIYVNNHKNALKLLSHTLSHLPEKTSSEKTLRETIDHLNNFQALLILSPQGSVLHQIISTNASSIASNNSSNSTSTNEITHNKQLINSIIQSPCFQQSLQGTSALSGITSSPSFKTPTILICNPVMKEDGTLKSILIGELNIEPLDKIRSRIAFGKLGHSAIVDQDGKVIAHPNKNWMKEMKDISDWPIVSKMMKGEQGVDEFYSPFIGEQMVAGYSGEPSTGWGIMVPQPKSEIESHVYELMKGHLYWGGLGLTCALIVAYILSRWITRPINLLAQQTSALRKSNFTNQIPSANKKSPKEIQQLTLIIQNLVDGFQKAQHQNLELNQSLAIKVEQATKDLKLANTHLERVALVDELTGLPNRRSIQMKLEMAQEATLEKIQRKTKETNKLKITNYSLLLCDLDRFKLVNDNHGHHIGDQVLKIFAERAPRELRQGDEIGRWGGEEFLCILKNTTPEEAHKTAERIRKTIHQNIILPNKLSIEMSVSIGVASYPESGNNIDVLLSNADTALYEAKRAGRNRVVSSNCEENGVFTIAGLIHDALTNHHFQAAYQPIIDLQTKEIVAEETLARIVTDNGILEAYQFIEAANQLQLTHKIDYQLISHTINRMTYHKKNNRKVHQFVNVSVDLLRNTEMAQDLVDQLDTWKNKNMPLDSNIVIEITEREFLGKTEDALRLLNPFLEKGYLLALDDFGSGYSSFQYLTDLPISYLKIEGSLVNRALKEPKVRSVLIAIQDTANDLNVITLAEGIENKETFMLLKELGIQLGQGYYLGRPEVPDINRA